MPDIDKSYRLIIALRAHRIEQRLGRRLTEEEYQRLLRADLYMDHLHRRWVCRRVLGWGIEARDGRICARRAR